MRPVKILIRLREYAQSDQNHHWVHSSDGKLSERIANDITLLIHSVLADLIYADIIA